MIYNEISVNPSKRVMLRSLAAVQAYDLNFVIFSGGMLFFWHLWASVTSLRSSTLWSCRQNGFRNGYQMPPAEQIRW